MESLSKKTIGSISLLSPLRKEDRIKALIRSHTSDEEACPFYSPDDPNVKSQCLLDPRAWRTWDCKGVCFFQGICCEYLLEGLKYRTGVCTGEL